ncbi:MAG: hypothetical protein C4338_05695, partial [Rhodanobacteraceae bacterium]
MTSTIPHRLAALRLAMRERGIAYCIVPTADPHLSEYLPEHWRTREWLSGFTGSAGTLVVGTDFAGLWTDSRYFEQAERELAGSGIKLMKLGVPHTPEHAGWLCEHVREGDRVACAAEMLSLACERSLREQLERRRAQLIEDDLPAQIWNDRPPLPSAPVFEHPLEYAIRSRAEKLVAVREAIRARGATHHLVSALDEIAWVLNLRGSDVEYNPVFLAHVLIDAERVTLFVDASKFSCSAPAPASAGRLGGGVRTAQDSPPPQPCPANARGGPEATGQNNLIEQLQNGGISVAPYESIGEALGNLPQDAKLLIAPEQISAAVAHTIPAHVQL